MTTAAGLAYREAIPEGDDGTAPVALMLHGWPQSSYIWRHALPAAAAAGWRAIAPDLAGYGDTPADPPATWERHIESLARFHAALDLGPVALIVHDWGGLIGLRWACDHPDAVRALVISDTGFFADGKWHGLAAMLRTEGQGEAFVEQATRELLGTALRQLSPAMPDDAIDEYAKAFADPDRRRGMLELYRSGDFEKLAPYAGRLAALGVPTLLLWGGRDEFAPVAGARRFQAEIPGAELQVVEAAGHFLMDDAPAASADAIAAFLRRL